MNSSLPPLLRELKGAPFAVWYALNWAHQTVSVNWLMDATDYDGKTVKKAMRLLKRLGHATYRGEDYCTDCQLTGGAHQLPLGMVALTEGEVDPAPLQAEVPLDDPLLSTNSGNDSHSSDGVLIILKDSLNSDSLKNNKNTGANSGNSSHSQEFRPLAGSPAKRGQSRHLADVARALLRKGLPTPADDDPFPADLRVAVERLVATVRVPRRRAERAVAHSPWPAAKIIEQAEIWLAHRRSPDGKGLDDGRFPYLVAARIEAGDECATDHRFDADVGDRYDGYAGYVADAPPSADAAERPGEPPATASRQAESLLWARVLEQIALEVPKVTFQTWLAPTRLRIDGDAYVVGAPSEHARDWLENRMTTMLARTLAGLTGGPVTLRFEVMQTNSQEHT